MQILQWNSFPPAYIFNVIATLIINIGLFLKNIVGMFAIILINDKMTALTCC